MAANILATNAQLTDANGKVITSVAEGSLVSVGISFRTQELPTSASYVAKVSLDDTIRTVTLNRGAGMLAPTEFFVSVNDWIVRPGPHVVTVQMDARNSVVESNESDNAKTFQFTPVTFQSAFIPDQKFIQPLPGVAFVNWTITNYVDLNSQSDVITDYRGGSRSYDGHDALDITLAGFQTPERFISMDIGVPEFAVADGIVVESHDGEFDRNTNMNSKPANYVTIDHGNGWRTSYYHMRKNSVLVKVGDIVKAGDTIGLVGSSGSSTDPHLHFAVRFNGMTVETYVNPTAYWVSPLPYAGDLPQRDAQLIHYTEHHITENGVKATLDIKRVSSTPLSSVARIHYATSDLTAKAGVDYVATSGDVTLAAFQTNGKVSVPLITDQVHEVNTKFRMLFTDVDTLATWYEDWTILDANTLIRFHPAFWTLDINAATNLVNDSVTLGVDVDDTNLLVNVNGEKRVVPQHLPIGDVVSVDVVTGDGADTINIYETSQNIAVTVKSGVGLDIFNVGAPDLLFSNRHTLGGVRGKLTLQGGLGNDRLNLLDNNVTNSAHTYNIASGSFSRENTAIISAVDFANVDLLAGEGNDRFNVKVLTGQLGYSLDAGGGADILSHDFDTQWTVTGVNSGSVDNVRFKNMETLLGGSGKDSFVFYPGGSLSGNVFGGGDVDTLNYSNINDPVSINLGTVHASFIGGVFNSIEQAFGGDGSDRLIGSSVVNNRWDIYDLDKVSVGRFNASGFENLVGGTLSDNFVFSDGQGVSGVVDGGGGSDTLNYSQSTTPVFVRAGSHKVTGTGGFLSIENFEGGTKTDVLVGSDAENVFNVLGMDLVSLLGMHFKSFETLVGGAQNDRYVFSDGAGLTGQLDGKVGSDTLDYSAYTFVVKSDLSLGITRGVFGKVSNFENVIGGAAADILVGNQADNTLIGNGGDDLMQGLGGADVLIGGSGNDQLDGGTERDILIGGLGADTLAGGSDDDIVIGGATAFDSQPFVLELMRQQWKRTDLTYNQRISTLRTTGVFAGQFKLNAASVLNDRAVDSVFGGVGFDWFWAFPADTSDRSVFETLN